jgi:hypothetical protein
MRLHYDKVQPKYVEFARGNPDFMGDPAMQMPENPDPAEFANLHEPQSIFVHPITREGLAYLGLSSRATWEPEHGVG